jgi:DNA-binding XRE family transcriptional regulator
VSDAKVKKLPEGWREGTLAKFLGLTPEDDRLIKIRHEIACTIRRRRKALGLTQTAIAKRMGMEQERVARIESGHPEVSLDQLVHCLLILGGDLRLTGYEAAPQVVADDHHEPPKAKDSPTKKAPARKSPVPRAAAKS